MLILALGSEYFHFAFQKLGHSVLIPPHQEGVGVDALYNNLQDRPDLIVFTDHLGQHAFPDGLSNIYGIPKIYYAVDAPINFWWQKHYARLFDYTFVDQKPYVSMLEDEGARAGWLPVAVDVRSYLPEENEPAAQTYDFGFVGAIDPGRRPKRSRLVETLSNRYTLKTAGDRQEGWLTPVESGQIYRQSKLALNECLFPGVTTRMLEAMASGSVLFTEKAGGDLGELFKPGEDFAWFEPDEVLAAADYWLGDDKRRRKTAKRALEKVAANHDIVNRAETLLNSVRRMERGVALVDVEAWDHEARALFLTALRWPQQEGQARVIRAEKLFRRAEQEGAASPTGLYMLGHIQRMRHNVDEAERLLVKAYEDGEPRGALSMGILHLGMGRLESSREWMARFAGDDTLSSPEQGTLPFDHVKAAARRLMELGHDVSPGFSRLPHDPAVWNALEFYQAAHSSRPDDLEVAREMAQLLYSRGATAEALDVAQKALEKHPDDGVLGGIFSAAGRASYLTIN
ncbi:MAG: glycosyltransferase [Deltaproteobacteria bacterium]|jgi:tetratricopeptide (TPR) repeat protein|nr:glycosyltransferase [Deltaproteobacteria bacterium]